MAGAIVGLDLARNTGYAKWQPGWERPVWGSWMLAEASGPGCGRTLLDLFNKLMEITEEGVDYLYFEAPWLGQGQYNEFTKKVESRTSATAARKLHSYGGITEMVAEVQDVKSIFECHSGEHRKHFLGVGMGKRDIMKKMIVDACWAKDWKVDNDDQGEALSVLCFGAADRGLEVPWDNEPAPKRKLPGKGL